MLVDSNGALLRSIGEVVVARANVVVDGVGLVEAEQDARRGRRRVVQLRVESVFGLVAGGVARLLLHTLVVRGAGQIERQIFAGIGCLARRLQVLVDVVGEARVGVHVAHDVHALPHCAHLVGQRKVLVAIVRLHNAATNKEEEEV